VVRETAAWRATSDRMGRRCLGNAGFTQTEMEMDFHLLPHTMAVAIAGQSKLAGKTR